VLRKLQELAATLAVLMMLLVTFMAINPRGRERFGEMMTTRVQGSDVRSSLGPISHAAHAAVAIGSDYAVDNPVLFSFVVVAAVLFMLMLRS
jgi:hypothetical protein